MESYPSYPLQRCQSINENRLCDKWTCERFRVTGKGPDRSNTKHRTHVRSLDEVKKETVIATNETVKTTSVSTD